MRPLAEPLKETYPPVTRYAITARDSGSERLLQQPRLLQRGADHAIDAMEFEARIREKMKEQMRQIPRMLHVQIMPEIGTI